MNANDQKLRAVLGSIPQDHPWFRAVIAVVRELEAETRPLVMTCPTVPNADAERHWACGRYSALNDVEARLRSYQTQGERE